MSDISTTRNLPQNGEMVGWHPVERSPYHEGVYLVFMPKRSLDLYSCQHWDRLDGWSNNFGITHWMPLPAPPTIGDR